ncbi:MAG: rhodanese-like domain-containing protein [Gammaproteobacteria bacterium]|nr:rhodanese-like domain-containing protein [Gammaproteobacteria bacterium]
MEILFYALLIFTTAVTLVLWGRMTMMTALIQDMQGDLRRLSNNSGSDQSGELETLRSMVKALAAGEKVDEDMIEEGRTWRELDPREGPEFVAGANVHVIDVRSPMECAAGMIPGATQLPIQELEERFAEIANDDRQKLIVCAMGVRSAAACEFLSQKGFTKLVNLGGGMASWSGAVERP